MCLYTYISNDTDPKSHLSPQLALFHFRPSEPWVSTSSTSKSPSTSTTTTSHKTSTDSTSTSSKYRHLHSIYTEFFDSVFKKQI